MSNPASSEIGAIVLSGGRGRRIDNAAKGTITVAGQSLLSRVLQALEGMPVVVVGDDVVPAHVGRVREDPPFSGPAAAIAAATPHIHTRHILIMAVDLPFAAGAVPYLAHASADADGVIAIDPDGRPQYLLSRIRRDRLQSALSRQDSWAGQSVRSLFSALTLNPVAFDAQTVLDVDTWEDVRVARNWSQSSIWKRGEK